MTQVIDPMYLVPHKDDPTQHLMLVKQRIKELRDDLTEMSNDEAIAPAINELLDFVLDNFSGEDQAIAANIYRLTIRFQEALVAKAKKDVDQRYV